MKAQVVAEDKEKTTPSAAEVAMAGAAIAVAETAAEAVEAIAG